MAVCKIEFRRVCQTLTFSQSKTIAEIGFGTIARIIEALVCVVCLSLWPKQMTLTSAMTILVTMLKLIQ